MLGRIAREEAGMTMALAIMMIVLIAVMGAGLLTFAMRDLSAVVEINQGQKASEAAEAGIHAAKRQLLANSFPNLYNDPATATFTPDPANVQWAATVAFGGVRWLALGSRQMHNLCQQRRHEGHNPLLASAERRASGSGAGQIPIMLR